MPPKGDILRSKMPELVLYGMRLLAKQFLGTILDIEVDQSDLAVVLLPTRGQAPPPSLLLQPLRLHHGGVEGDVRQYSKLDHRVFQVLLATESVSQDMERWLSPGSPWLLGKHRTRTC